MVIAFVGDLLSKSIVFERALRDRMPSKAYHPHQHPFIRSIKFDCSIVKRWWLLVFFLFFLALVKLGFQTWDPLVSNSTWGPTPFKYSQSPWDGFKHLFWRVVFLFILVCFVFIFSCWWCWRVTFPSGLSAIVSAFHHLWNPEHTSAFVDQPKGASALWNDRWLADKFFSWDRLSVSLNRAKGRCRSPNIFTDYLNYNILRGHFCSRIPKVDYIGCKEWNNILFFFLWNWYKKCWFVFTV